jgi:hypothetical protein
VVSSNIHTTWSFSTDFARKNRFSARIVVVHDHQHQGEAAHNHASRDDLLPVIEAVLYD